jgi:hypothetical protein
MPSIEALADRRISHLLWAQEDLNLRPTAYEAVALTPELWARLITILKKGQDRQLKAKRPRRTSPKAASNSHEAAFLRAGLDLIGNRIDEKLATGTDVQHPSELGISGREHLYLCRGDWVPLDHRRNEDCQNLI